MILQLKFESLQPVIIRSEAVRVVSYGWSIGQDGLDGQSDSLEDVGSRVSSGITIQGAGPSSRRPRLGKIVKYIVRR